MFSLFTNLTHERNHKRPVGRMVRGGIRDVFVAWFGFVVPVSSLCLHVQSSSVVGQMLVNYRH